MEIFPFFLVRAGCPGRCVFCNQQMSTAQSFGPHPEKVAKELEKILPESSLGEVAFYGGSFTGLAWPDQKAYLGSAGTFVEQGRATGIRISTRPDLLDQAMVDRLCANGVTTVEIGCQSFSDRVLDESGRGHGAADSRAAVIRLQKAALKVGIQLMPGLPGADSAEALFSLHEALLLGPDFIRIYPVVILAGTRLAELWEEGAYRPLSLEQAVDICGEMLLTCHLAKVPVIRVGLQATTSLDGDAVLAGPYHPAFGQLVRSGLWRRALQKILAGDAQREVLVHPSDVSDVIGQRRTNLLQFMEQGELKIVPTDSMSKETFSVAGRVHSLWDCAAYA